jgi:acyl-CoA thioester hydrolase
MPKKPLHTSQLIVRFFDLDLSSTVFFINYMKWFDSIAADDYLRGKGVLWEQLFQDQIDVAIANVNFDYKRPLFLNDLVDICIEEVILGNKSMQLCGSLYHHESGELVAAGKIVYVFVDVKTRQPVFIPEHVRKLLSEKL